MRFPPNNAGALRIGIDDAVTAAPVSTLLRLLRTDFPALRWSLHDAHRTQLYKALCGGEIDIAIWRGEPIETERLMKHRLYQQFYCREETAVALPRGHRLARRNCIALSDFGDDALLLAPGCARSLPTLMAMVGSGLGGALVPGSAGSIVFPNVTVRRLRGAPATDVYLAYGIDSRSGGMQPFLEALNAERGVRPFQHKQFVSFPPPSKEL